MDFTAEKYVDDVLSGEQVACRWVRLACERHRRDLVDGGERGLFFDVLAAKKVIVFFRVLRHSKGEWSGREVELEPWQQFQLWVLFGWMRLDAGGNPVRRFRTGYVEVARKNGKSTVGAGIGLYLLTADGEAGAEVYTAATTRAQARIVHLESVRMVKQSPVLGNMLTLHRDNIHDKRTFSKFEPLGRDSKSLDGLSVSGAIIDEFHAHVNGEMYDVLETATGSRRSPLLYVVTTSGNNRQSICFQFNDYTEKVLSGVIVDDAWFGIIYTLDRDDEGVIEDWENEDCWVKANPNLGVSKKVGLMQETAHKAKQMPARLNTFLQKHLNIWTSAGSRWISPDAWRRCNVRPVDEEALAGRECWAGLDLSSTLDVTALLLVFPPIGDDGVHDVVCRFFIPEDNMRERVRRDRVPFDAWVRDGWVTATPGDVVDYDFILAQARADSSAFKLAEIAFDPWNATSTSTKLMEDGAEVVEFRQGFVSMNPAMKAVEVAIKQRTLNHGGNPVLSWMADNLVAKSDPAGNLKPDKDKSREKIDGMVALFMAYYRATLELGSRVSVYSDRGLRTL